MRGIALKLAVGVGSPRQLPKATHAIVRLSEHELSEQTDRDQADRGADDREQQLGVDPGWQSRDGPDQRIEA